MTVAFGRLSLFGFSWTDHSRSDNDQRGKVHRSPHRHLHLLLNEGGAWLAVPSLALDLRCIVQLLSMARILLVFITNPLLTCDNFLLLSRR